MSIKSGGVPKIHFHIRWLGIPRLDWEAFSTREEAEARAHELAKPGEVFVVEVFYDACPQCGSYRSAAAS